MLPLSRTQMMQRKTQRRSLGRLLLRLQSIVLRCSGCTWYFLELQGHQSPNRSRSCNTSRRVHSRSADRISIPLVLQHHFQETIAKVPNPVPTLSWILVLAVPLYGTSTQVAVLQRCLQRSLRGLLLAVGASAIFTRRNPRAICIAGGGDTPH